MNRTSNIRRTVTVLAAITVMAIGSVAIAPSAGAFQASGSGTTGSTTIALRAQALAGWEGGTLSSPFRTVTESSLYRNYDQYVCVTTRLFILKNGPYAQSWSYQRQATSCAWIPAAASYTSIAGQAFTGLLPTQAYSIDVTMTWRLSNGYTLGTMNVDYDRAADYQCLNNRCTAITTSVGGGVYINY